MSGVSYLSSTRLVLDVVNGANLGADVLQIRCWSVDRPGGSMSTGHCRFLLQWDLLGHRGFGDDPAAVSGAGVSISGGNWSSRSGGGGWARTSYRKMKKKVRLKFR